MTTLHGKTAMVTGSGTGIGRATAERLLAEGVRVIGCGRRARPADLPEAIAWQRTDVSDTEQVRALVAEAQKSLGGVDILVNNAGIQIEKTVPDTTDADWEALMGANARGVFLCCREVLPLMIAAGRGVIVNIGSISGNSADPGLALYNASKAFVHGLTRSIAVDHGKQGIRCNAICPGWIMTGMADAAFEVANNPSAAREDALARHAAGRFGKPEDIANAVAWLASEQAEFVTGQTFVIDGGLSAASPLNPALF